MNERRKCDVHGLSQCQGLRLLQRKMIENCVNETQDFVVFVPVSNQSVLSDRSFYVVLLFQFVYNCPK